MLLAIGMIGTAETMNLGIRYCQLLMVYAVTCYFKKKNQKIKRLDEFGKGSCTFVV